MSIINSPIVITLFSITIGVSCAFLIFIAIFADIENIKEIKASEIVKQLMISVVGIAMYIFTGIMITLIGGTVLMTASISIAIIVHMRKKDAD